MFFSGMMQKEPRRGDQMRINEHLHRVQAQHSDQGNRILRINNLHQPRRERNLNSSIVAPGAHWEEEHPASLTIGAVFPV